MSSRWGPHALVIGGGVIGVTTAAALARRGMKVTLIERAQTLASGATARNGAQLSYSYVDALASPSIVRDLPRLLSGLDPGFRIHPGLSPRFLAWSLRFLANCWTSRYVENTLAVLRLALCSRASLAALRASHPEIEFRHTVCGKLHIFDSRRKFDIARAGIQLKNPLGFGLRSLEVDELFAIEPALSTSTRNIVGAIHSPTDAAGDPYLFTHALATVAEREHGATFLTNTAAEGFVMGLGRVQAANTTHGPIEADTFVIATGCDSCVLARTAGLSLPIYPMKGYSVTLPATASSPTTSITDTRARLVVCRLQDKMRIAGMAELGCSDSHVDCSRIRWLLSSARACLPAAADWQASPSPWSGVRPMTPDSRPIIGVTPIKNLFLNCGHGMLGWTLACGSAELLTDLIVPGSRQRESCLMANDFSIARFSRSG